MRTVARNTALLVVQWSCILAAAVVVAHWFSAGPSAIIEDRPVADPGPSLVERLMDRADCWTGDAPADVEIPGHALVDTGSGPEVVASQIGFDVWEGKAPGHLYAFCR